MHSAHIFYDEIEVYSSDIRVRSAGCPPGKSFIWNTRKGGASQGTRNHNTHNLSWTYASSCVSLSSSPLLTCFEASRTLVLWHVTAPVQQSGVVLHNTKRCARRDAKRWSLGSSPLTNGNKEDVCVPTPPVFHSLFHSFEFRLMSYFDLSVK